MHPAQVTRRRCAGFMQKKSPPGVQSGGAQFVPWFWPQAPAVNSISVRTVTHLGADLLSQDIDRHQFSVALEMPVGPAVA